MDNVTLIDQIMDSFVYLRHDYGSTWNGEIIISNCTFTPRSEATDIYLVWWGPQVTNGVIHNYGYDLYLPDVTVNGLTINGDNVENLYIFNQSNTYLNSLTIDPWPSGNAFHTYYNPTIVKNNITGSNSNMVISNYIAN